MRGLATTPRRLCWVLLVLATGASACHRTSPSSASSSEATVEQVLANPQAYAHRLVTIRGCYVSSFERSTIEPCQNGRLQGAIWLEDAALIHSFEQLQPPGIRVPQPLGLQTSPKSVLVFQYDAAKNRAAWKRLMPEAIPAIYRSETTLVGQFETIAPQEPGPIRSGFGHLGVFTHELILVDVLRSKPLDSAP
jgi:hypothetical protein